MMAGTELHPAQAFTEEQKRQINFLRGIAIFLMLWGHCIQYCCLNRFDFFEDIVFKLIYSFHMPLFMLISGYLFFFSAQKRTRLELLQHRTRSLLLPIFMCGLLNWLLSVVPSCLLAKDVSSLKNVWNGGWLSNIYSFTFLWSVLAASVPMSFAAKAHAVWLKIVFGLGGLLFACILPNSNFSLYLYPYFVVGYCCAKYRMRVGKLTRRIVGTAASLLFLVMLCFFEKKHYIYTSGLFGARYSPVEYIMIDGFRWIIGLAGCIFVVIAGRALFLCLNRCGLGRWIAKTVETMGRRSLEIYALSLSVLSGWLPRKAMLFLSGKGLEVALPRWVFDLLLTLGLAIAFSALLLACIRFLEKTNLKKYIFGR